MNKPSICCVVPSIRPEQMAEFRKAWAPLFERHGVTLVTVWDGEEPITELGDSEGIKWLSHLTDGLGEDPQWLFSRKTDAVRNYGFVEAANRQADYILTLDDDVHPPAGSDPIQEHLDVLQRRVPISWMNTALPWKEQDCHPPRTGENIYLRGFPYVIRDEAPVKVSHGVWVNVPDFDGKTQLELGKCMKCNGTGWITEHSDCGKCDGTGYDGSRLPYSLPYFRGPIPKGAYFPFCGMNAMVHRDALPYLYFAPMGPDSGVDLNCPKCNGLGEAGPGLALECLHCNGTGKGPTLNRFADIWCGILLKRATDSLGWAIYTGASTVIHTRASDPFKNVEQERLGVEWNEWAWRQYGPEYANSYPKLEGADTQSHAKFREYWRSYLDKAARFRDLIRKLQGAT